jgi:hypothetical protein
MKVVSSNIYCSIKDPFSFDVFMNYSAENMFVEKHGLLSGTYIVQYSINKPLKLCVVQMQIREDHTMLQHEGLTKHYTENKRSSNTNTT